MTQTTFSAVARATTGAALYDQPIAISAFFLDLGEYCEGIFGYAGLAALRAGGDALEGRVSLARKGIDGARQALEDDAPHGNLAGDDRLDIRLIVEIDLAAGRSWNIRLGPEDGIEGFVDHLRHRLERDDASLLESGFQPAPEP